MSFIAGPLSRKSARNRIAITAFLFFTPVWLYCNHRADVFTVSSSEAFDAGVLASLFGIVSGVGIGAFLTGYSSLLFRPRHLLGQLGTSALHAALWTLLWIFFTNAFLYWDFRGHFPMAPHLRSIAQFYLECLIYSVPLVLITSNFARRSEPDPEA